MQWWNRFCSYYTTNINKNIKLFTIYLLRLELRVCIGYLRFGTSTLLLVGILWFHGVPSIIVDSLHLLPSRLIFSSRLRHILSTGGLAADFGLPLHAVTCFFSPMPYKFLQNFVSYMTMGCLCTEWLYFFPSLFTSTNKFLHSWRCAISKQLIPLNCGRLLIFDSSG